MRKHLNRSVETLEHFYTKYEDSPYIKKYLYGEKQFLPIHLGTGIFKTAFSHGFPHGLSCYSIRVGVMDNPVEN